MDPHGLAQHRQRAQAFWLRVELFGARVTHSVPSYSSHSQLRANPWLTCHSSGLRAPNPELRAKPLPSGLCPVGPTAICASRCKCCPAGYAPAILPCATADPYQASPSTAAFPSPHGLPPGSGQALAPFRQARLLPPTERGLLCP